MSQLYSYILYIKINLPETIALFQEFNENRSVFDHSIEHIMKNISNL